MSGRLRADCLSLFVFSFLVEFGQAHADAYLLFLHLVTLLRNTFSLRHTTMPAHQPVGFSTLRITPRSSICWSSLLTIANSGIETRHGVVIANGWESLHSLISYCTGIFPTSQIVSDGLACRSPQTPPCQQTLVYLVMTSSGFRGHRCPPPTWRLLATICQKICLKVSKLSGLCSTILFVDSQSLVLPTFLLSSSESIVRPLLCLT